MNLFVKASHVTVRPVGDHVEVVAYRKTKRGTINLGKVLFDNIEDLRKNKVEIAEMLYKDASIPTEKRSQSKRGTNGSS